MKFLFVSYVLSNDFNNPEAWLKRINAYAGILEALAITDTVISIEQIDYEGEVTKNGVHYYFKKLTANQRRFPQQLHHFIKEQQPDIVVVNGMIFPLQVIQLRRTLGSTVKIIVQNHAEQPYNHLRKYLQRLADRYVDAYFFASQNMGLNWVNRGNLASASKIHEVMEVSSVFSPINRACAQSKTGITQQHSVFLWVGRLNANKNPLNVVKAFLTFSLKHPLAKLYMVYQNEDLLNDINQLLTQHPNSNKSILLIGRIPHQELIYWYNSVDFIISGSHYEGSGTAVCEAMSCGCIPVVTAIDAFKMVTDNGNCGVLYQPGDELDLLRKLESTRHINILEMRRRVLDYYKATLSFGAIANRFREVGTMLLS